MTNVLPSGAGVTVGGVIYRYTLTKIPGSDPLLSVTIRNKNAIDNGYIFSETDEWPESGTINKIVPLPDIAKQYFGDGEIITNQDGGIISDPNVVYNYKYDTCFEPLSSPECPGFDDALYDWLKLNGYLDGVEPIDPYGTDAVQNALDNDLDLDENDKYKEDNNQDADEDKRRKLIADESALMAEAAALQAAFESLAMMPSFNQYYEASIEGGQYDEVVNLQDGFLPDNPRAMRSLATDKKFNEIVRSQYDR